MGERKQLMLSIILALAYANAYAGAIVSIKLMDYKR